MTQNIIVYDQDPVFLNYISNALGVPYDSRYCKTLAHVRKNDNDTYTILCVVLFSRFAKHHCEVSIASSTERWATWNFLHAVYELGFADGRQRLNMVVEPHNNDAITLHEKLGHVREGLLHDVYGRDKDGIMFAYTRQMWEKGRWYYRKRNKLD